MRTSRKTVIFGLPFTRIAPDAQQPAGPQTVDTDEEPLESPSTLAHRRVATTVYPLPRHSTVKSVRALSVGAQELDAAHRSESSSLGPSRGRRKVWQPLPV